MPSLRTLDWRVRVAAERLFHLARRYGPYVVTSARRTRQEQARLYSEYLAGRNDGLPATPPGTSEHEAGLAFDMAAPNHDPFDDPYLPLLGEVWRSWGGSWSSRDPVHFGYKPPSRVRSRGRQRMRSRHTHTLDRPRG